MAMLNLPGIQLSLLAVFLTVLISKSKLGLDIDIDAEIAMYKEYAEKIRPFVIDSVEWLTGKF